MGVKCHNAPFMSDHYFLTNDAPRRPLLFTIGFPIAKPSYPHGGTQPLVNPQFSNPVSETATNPEWISPPIGPPWNPPAGTQHL